MRKTSGRKSKQRKRIITKDEVIFIVKESYYDNLRMIDELTDKVMLTKTDVANLLKISRPTVQKIYGKLFKDGFISKASLARALTK
jgi:CRP-like cAMP-binding protein